MVVGVAPAAQRGAEHGAVGEVGGGDLERLKEVSANMDKVFALT